MHFLKGKWVELCNREQSDLNERRHEVLFAKGENPKLLEDLLRDAQRWTVFRTYLRGQVNGAREFSLDYSRRHDEGRVLKHLHEAIDDFSKEINSKISQLDELSNDLIRVEFNLVSINEARGSTTAATSMKRLSWVTFIFLPAMFTSSLFGMNVDILKGNPDWRWYILFGGVCLTLTLTGWLIFKYCPIEKWVERHIGTKIEKAIKSGSPKNRTAHLVEPVNGAGKC
ncbi:hypothetical protein FQN52_003323 [Onygenales sp. PD_12]|nr:hypothetical protein FQN52_003323 [Onygenales sp. PD_12]